ncbi:MAG TPA: hypothetical protein DCX34_03430 [Roseovarius sp.]|nr:hypothetical protein [Roseovarius sp.]
MKIGTGEWPDDLKTVCQERCAEMGEAPCWEIDQSINPADPDRGTVCEQCQTEAFALRVIRENPKVMARLAR